MSTTKNEKGLHSVEFFWDFFLKNLKNDRFFLNSSKFSASELNAPEVKRGKKENWFCFMNCKIQRDSKGKGVK